MGEGNAAVSRRGSAMHWGKILAGFAGNFATSFAFATITIMLIGRRTTDPVRLVFFGFLAAVRIPVYLLMIQVLVPKECENWPHFRMWAIGIGISYWIFLVLEGLEAIDDLPIVVRITMTLGKVSSSSFGVFFIPLWVFAKNRNLNFFRGNNAFIWLVIFPLFLSWIIGGFWRYERSAFLLGAVGTTTFWILGVILSLKFDKTFHDDAGYIVHCCIGSILAPSLFPILTRILLSVTGFGVLTLIAVKLVFFIAIVILQELLGNIQVTDRQAVFPLLFPLQISEELSTSSVYLAETLSWEFALTLLVMLLINGIRDSGYGYELWLRCVRFRSSASQIPIAIAKEFYVTQQNLVAEILAIPCLCLIVLAEYIFGNPIFTASVTNEERRELLVVYCILLISLIPPAVWGWKFFKDRVRGNAIEMGTVQRENVAETDQKMHVVDMHGEEKESVLVNEDMKEIDRTRIDTPKVHSWGMGNESTALGSHKEADLKSEKSRSPNLQHVPVNTDSDGKQLSANGKTTPSGEETVGRSLVATHKDERRQATAVRFKAIVPSNDITTISKEYFTRYLLVLTLSGPVAVTGLIYIFADVE